jgi:hypothetical protein
VTRSGVAAKRTLTKTQINGDTARAIVDGGLPIVVEDELIGRLVLSAACRTSRARTQR